MTLDLVLVGFGHVARRFVTLLQEQRARLERNYGLRTRVVGIVTKRHGQRFSARGIDAVALARSVAQGDSILPVASGFSRTRERRREQAPTLRLANTPSVEFLRDVAKHCATAAREGRLVVVETTTLDVESGQPAIDHIRAALANGAHVVTANKGPVAFAYRDLAREAERAGRRFLFEGAVMDGVPVFNLARETLPAVTIVGFRGVVNSTTNFILTAMEQGQPFERALAEMQAMGIAEADPSLDVDGWDAAAKAAALANVLLGARLTPRTVERQGITPEIGRRAVQARAAGRRVKLVARGGWEGSRITASVAPEDLPEDDLLAGLEGQQNAIIFHTDLLGEIAVIQRGSGLTQTAYALVSDLVSIVNPGALLGRPRASRRSRS